MAEVVEAKLTDQEAVDLAWRRGFLKFKLYEYQYAMYDALWAAIRDKNCLKYSMLSSRRNGKSFILVLVAIEYAIRHPNSQIRFAAPTAKALRKIIFPILKKILVDCPDSLTPKHNRMDDQLDFFNGSQIHFAGTDNGHSENLRGTESHLNIIDEAGFCTDLLYLLKDILVPQTLTTNGTTILATTPPKTPAHDFVQIYAECEELGHFQKFDVYANDTLTKEKVDLYARESGGYDSTTFKREYLCIFVTDEESALVPEWKPEYERAVEPDEFRPYYHNYVAMDIGVRDFTALLYGYYDFQKGALIIEDESAFRGIAATTDIIKADIVEKETSRFPSTAYKRIADNNNLILLNDLSKDLPFLPVLKDNLHAMVNELRLWVKAGRVIVHPRCKKLTGCLKYGVWNEKRDKFDRTETLGHFDHLAALMYLVRSIDQWNNPIPVAHNKSSATHFFVDPPKKPGFIRFFRPGA